MIMVKFEWDSNTRIGFFSGVALISLINIALIATNQNQYLFDWYILGISIVIIVIMIIMKIRSTK
jgi:cytochrome oxidase assembly protein ShyY1